MKNNIVHRQTVYPRYRGFNLLGMFCSKTSTRNLGRAPGYYDEKDFKTIANWGFDYVRLPISYRIWSTASDSYTVAEEKLRPLDDAIEYAMKYNLSLTIGFHRIPGYCVNEDEPEKEPYSLWHDEEAKKAAEFQWKVIAERYKDVPASVLSFNIINEPPWYISSTVIAAVTNRLCNAIRVASPERPIMIDGTSAGQRPPLTSMLIYEKNCGYACRGYLPSNVTHYGAEWSDGSKRYLPKWPDGGVYGAIGDVTIPYGVEEMDNLYNIWAAHAEIFDVGVVCGEMGCYNKTPHDVTLSWFEDELKTLKKHNIGYALWNFKGAFGIVDSGRNDVDYVSIDGYNTDKKLLELLLKY